jgi:TM2 domain-containing membrane protein YozV
MTKIYELMPDIQGEEMLILNNLCRDYSEEKLRNFATIYRTRRKDPMLILVLTLIGLVGFAGIHRMVLNQIGLGILYFFTGGLCLIGTIVDAVNYQQLSLQFNRQLAMEVHQLLNREV